MTKQLKKDFENLEAELWQNNCAAVPSGFKLRDQEEKKN